MEIDEAEKFFPKDFTAKDRAVFEAGIALGAIYHQIIGFPVSRDPELLRLLGEAFSKSFSLQPYRSKVEIRIARERLRKPGKSPYQKYEALRGDQLEVEVETVYQDVRVKACLRYVPELKYPLMYVEKVSERRA